MPPSQLLATSTSFYELPAANMHAHGVITVPFAWRLLPHRSRKGNEGHAQNVKQLRRDPGAFVRGCGRRHQNAQTQLLSTSGRFCERLYFVPKASLTATHNLFALLCHYARSCAYLADCKANTMLERGDIQCHHQASRWVDKVVALRSNDHAVYQTSWPACLVSE